MHASTYAALLSGYGARPWQVALAEPVLTAAILEADLPVEEPVEGD